MGVPIPINTLLKDFAEHIGQTETLKGCDPFGSPGTLGRLPRAVLHYDDSPVVEGPSRHEVFHNVKIEILVADKSNIPDATEQAATLIEDVKLRIRTKDEQTGKGGITLGGQNIDIKSSSQQIDEATYGGKVYVAAIVRVTMHEIADVDYE